MKESNRKADHPSIFVFDAKGKYVRSFGKQFQGGVDMVWKFDRKEKSNSFMSLVTMHLKTFAKLDMKGETVWQKYAPMQSKLYAKGRSN